MKLTSYLTIVARLRMSGYIILLRCECPCEVRREKFTFYSGMFSIFRQSLKLTTEHHLGLRLRIIYKYNKDLCTTVPNGSLTFVTGQLSRLKGISDWYLRSYGFKYGTEDRQPSVIVRNAAMVPKIRQRLSYCFYTESAGK